MASAAHGIFCFETLVAQLHKRQPVTLSKIQESWSAFQSQVASSSSSSSSSATSGVNSSASTTDEFPLFVTWNTHPIPGSSDHDLRGCIGTFGPLPLADGLRSYALTAALEDPRFPPITAAELRSLSVSVTLLTDFEQAADPLDWDLGTHGLRITFAARPGGVRHYSATYLPDVAPEQGWDKPETLVHLMAKAGWKAKGEQPWEGLDMEVVRYQGKKASVGWKMYERWSQWFSSSDTSQGKNE